MFSLLLLAIVIYFYYTGDLQRMFGNLKNSSTADNGSAARKALDMRYASGEISTEEYTKIKNLL